MMEYNQFDSHPRLKPFVVCVWTITGTDKMPQKIVADGFSELIFHFGDLYRIQKSGQWTTQSRALVARQIDSPVQLQPSGLSGVIGFKFRPTGLWSLFRWNMRLLRNEVVPLQELLSKEVQIIEEKLCLAKTNCERINIVEDFLLAALPRADHNTIHPLLETIKKTPGEVRISELTKKFNLSSRKLERLFNEQIGVSPKVYTRIIRFKQIFHLLQQKNLTTVEATYLCGYFDQPHFNKDFKIFSGEDAQSYFRKTHAMADFLMNA